MFAIERDFKKNFQNVLLWHELVQFTSTRRGTFFCADIYVEYVCVNFRTLSPLLTSWVFPLAFLGDDPDQNQWSEITRIIVDQMNRWIHSGEGFIGSFDLPWSKWSRIADPDPDHPKETHPLKNTMICFNWEEAIWSLTKKQKNKETRKKS